MQGKEGRAIFLEELYGELESGYLYLWTLPDKQTYWFKTSKLEEMQQKAKILSDENKDVYFGVGITKEPKFLGRAKATEVIGIPGVWLDIDIKDDAHVQTNLPETIAEIENKLPLIPSIIVHSGHGLHAYWLFKEPWVFDSEAERMQAENLLKGFQLFIKQQLGYKLDSTHDLSRVLRVPETINYKTNPTQVSVLHKNDIRFNIDDIEQFTLDIQLIEYDASREKFKRLPTDDDSLVVIENCKFIQHCKDNAKTLPEPEWLAMIANIARCKDGPQMVHELSSSYPRYNKEETDKKIIHALNNLNAISCNHIKTILKFDCPVGGCGVKAPCAFALKNKKAEEQSKPVHKLDALTDFGNAERFARMFKDKLKYCHQFGTWLIWNGVRHKIDEQGQVMDFAQKAIRSIHEDLNEIVDPDRRKKVFNHAEKSESLPRLKAMLELAQHMLAVHVNDLDTDKWILNVKNGVVDLKTGKLLAHNQSRLITKLAPVIYDETAECPRFIQFMNDVFDNDKDIIDFMQRLLGYCLTGDTSEQMMSFAYGAMGSNGKSTLMELFMNMIGDYGETTGSDTFTLKRNEGIPNDIARLRGARFVKISELKENTKLNEALIKQITGQDKLTARFLRQEFFTFMPAFKLMILTNHKPKLTGDDPALWRRITLIPFLQRFTGDRKDKELPDKLSKEWSGILNWCVKGCLEWQKNGLCPPDKVQNATKEFQNESDVITNWMEDCCLVKPHLQTKSGNLFASFEKWCEENGERVYISRNKFSQKLVEKGFQTHKGTNGARFIKGLGLLDLQRDIDFVGNEPY